MEDKKNNKQNNSLNEIGSSLVLAAALTGGAPSAAMATPVIDDSHTATVQVSNTIKRIEVPCEPKPTPPVAMSIPKQEKKAATHIKPYKKLEIKKPSIGEGEKPKPKLHRHFVKKQQPKPLAEIIAGKPALPEEKCYTYSKVTPIIPNLPEKPDCIHYDDNIVKYRRGPDGKFELRDDGTKISIPPCENPPINSILPEREVTHTVPEPGTLPLVVLGLSGLLASKRRRETFAENISDQRSGEKPTKSL